jgi:hypothetical protein
VPDMPHRCHAPGCDAPVPPKMFMCRQHWFALPKPLRDMIWATYRPGQEIKKNPSREYLAAAKAAIDFLEAARDRKMELALAKGDASKLF